MAKKQFNYRGKNIEELKSLSLEELSSLLNASARRKIKRGFTDEEKKIIKQIDAGKKSIKTHCRDMLILPSMVGLKLQVHNGKGFEAIDVTEEMLGGRLGEYSGTRKRLAHSSPGVGGTKSSSSVSVR